MMRSFSVVPFALMLVAMLAVTPAAAQKSAQAGGPPNAMQGFSQNRDKPVHIEAGKLEVRDKDKVATFSGNVQVIQGDTEMRSRTLVVFYEQDGDRKTGPAVQAATPGPGGEQRIKRLEAKGNVVVTQNDQVATGESALFDMKTNTITMSGKVVVTQGQNVLRGERLVVDMTTGTSRVESGDRGGDGRVQGLFLPGSATGGPGAKPPAPTAPMRAPQRAY